MKKSYISLITAIILLLLSGCESNNGNSTVKDGTYVMEYKDKDTEEVLLPRVIIDDDKIIFSHDLLSSYMPLGTYAIDDDMLTMTTDDNRYIYLFQIDEDILIFQKNGSSAIKMTDDRFGVHVKDQSKFKLSD